MGVGDARGKRGGSRRPLLAIGMVHGAWPQGRPWRAHGGADVGHILRINAVHAPWWWGVDFMLTGRRSYGTESTREDAMARIACRVPTLA